MIDTGKVTRFEVIDHTVCERCKGTGWLTINNKKRTCIDCKTAGSRGRILTSYGIQVELQLQDDGRTLKAFITDKEPASAKAS